MLILSLTICPVPSGEESSTIRRCISARTPGNVTFIKVSIISEMHEDSLYVGMTMTIVSMLVALYIEIVDAYTPLPEAWSRTIV